MTDSFTEGLATCQPWRGDGSVGVSAEAPAVSLGRTGRATVLPFGARPDARECLDTRVDHALTAIAAHRASAAGELYDLVSRPLYALVLAITRDEPAAQEATVAAFAEIWLTSAGRPHGASTAWVMDVACRCARATPTNRAARAPGRTDKRARQDYLRLVRQSPEP